jgi:hypothetical protein
MAPCGCCGQSAYVKSETLAERAAWDFMGPRGWRAGACGHEPTGIYGPVLGPGYPGSIAIVKALLDGAMPRNGRACDDRSGRPVASVYRLQWGYRVPLPHRPDTEGSPSGARAVRPGHAMPRPAGCSAGTPAGRGDDRGYGREPDPVWTAHGGPLRGPILVTYHAEPGSPSAGKTAASDPPGRVTVTSSERLTAHGSRARRPEAAWRSDLAQRLRDRPARVAQQRMRRPRG